MTTCQAIARGHSNAEDMHRSLKILALLEIHFDLRVAATHIKGVDNSVADAISRNVPDEARILHTRKITLPFGSDRTTPAAYDHTSASWPHMAALHELLPQVLAYSGDILTSSSIWDG
ncbi:hypothetical protein SARC_08003 [Sphaeroforma arctica JP610]|uniref:Uncharacterized protein n=1 Tax=Sphaeroforma arctica JP610 TaxID=667725 RepID=A0A0L0FSC8_9EUKA|nr:hypothetical protein SARC_08003 [Sphaeroforma arctica JP610]KNC79604.1 hypothetical protein SARC_08003 [Sphaeroforma arctica JP610]|eukprot:XP_014153506.1 hypothetical protein SARC_08003 [Sphaeroforma arctica JP610]